MKCVPLDFGQEYGGPDMETPLLTPQAIELPNGSVFRNQPDQGSEPAEEDVEEQNEVSTLLVS